MSKKNKEQNEADGLKKVENTLGKAEMFIETYIKELAIAVVVIAVVIAGFIFFRYQYMAPREIRAQEEMAIGERLFAADDFYVALHGDGSFLGFEGIIREFRRTETANLARAYAGVSHFKLGNYEAALEHLRRFDVNDNIIGPAIIGLIGDCYVELGQVDRAVRYFERAARLADNSLISPIFLKKAAIAHESLGNYNRALQHYIEIRDRFHDSPQAMEIERFIVRVTNLKNSN